MPKTLDDYRRKLVDKILISTSANDARRFSDAAIRSLREHNVHDYIIVRFIEKTIYNLDELCGQSIDDRQRYNLGVAVDHFRQLRKKFEGHIVS